MAKDRADVMRELLVVAIPTLYAIGLWLVAVGVLDWWHERV